MMDDAAALILVDMQKGFAHPRWGKRNNPEAEKNMSALLAHWRAAGRPVFHVKHNSRLAESPLNPSNPGNALQDAMMPAAGEPLIEKEVNCAFVGTPLERLLRAKGIADVVIVGLTTPHCISTTVRIGANLGFNVRVVEDATAAFQLHGVDGRNISPEEAHYHALAALRDEFAQVVTTEQLLSTGKYLPI
jgi:nicotinamidase-related amidase